MTEKKSIRLSKIAKEFNVGISTIVEFLQNKGIDIDPNPNTKISPDIHDELIKEFSSDIDAKKESEKLDIDNIHKSKKESLSIEDMKEEGIAEAVSDEKEEKEEVETEIESEEKSEEKTEKSKAKKEEKPKKVKTKEKTKKKEKEEKEDEKEEEEKQPKVIGKIDLKSINQKTRPDKKTKKEKEEEKAAETEEKENKKKSKEEKQEEKKPEEPEEKEIKETEEAVQEEDPSQKKEKEEETTNKDDQNNYVKTEFQKLSGPTVVGKIDLPEKAKKSKSEKQEEQASKKKKRKRIRKEKKRVDINGGEEGSSKEARKPKKSKKKKKPQRKEINDEEIQQQVKDTLAKLTSKGKSKTAKYRREKRDAIQQKQKEEEERQEKEKSVIKVAEFISASELASMMDVPINEVISACMNLGLFVSINQRLDAETITLVADEFNYSVEFTTVDVQESIEEEEEEDEKNLKHRPPVVTVMGHVDHGKTKLLDYVRSANVVAGEAGGITQHIGAYNVTLDNDKQITFLDTPGHEAFTAMRARGTQVTDLAIIVVAADDGVKPQTTEAINHAKAANIPIVFAINKIDKPTANPEKVKEELAGMNYLVEDWGGKYQSQDISAKNGINIDELLEKVLLEAELLELKANPSRKAKGTIIESTLDKGRGYVATILVQTGTLEIGDIMLAGSHSGHVKALYNERNQKIDEAGPAMPAIMLGLDGAPQAGDTFNVMDSDREAKEIANKRKQLQREQGLKAQKHITLDEIGRRIAIGDFQQLNVIVKGDVDGSVEALTDSIVKLSTEKIQVNIIHKGVGQISESDILLAAASNAVVIGFQVRPSLTARKIAEKEQIDIRLHSVIYDAVNELRDAMEGMLSPEVKERIIGTLEVQEVFKISKVGSIAGCIMKDGKISRDSKVRVIRDGIVVYTGDLGSLKRFKDDVKEVVSGQECGLNIENYNDIKVGDVIEAFKEIEVKPTL